MPSLPAWYGKENTVVFAWSDTLCKTASIAEELSRQTDYEKRGIING